MIAKLLGIGIPAWVYELVIVLACAGSAVLYLEHRGATHELLKLQVSSAKVLTSAREQIASADAAYRSATTTNQEKLNAATAANTALQSQLADSVRQYDAYRRAHPPVARATGPSVPASAGECGSESCGAIIDRLAMRGNELAGVDGSLAEDLRSCQRDRDALTGLPK